MAFTFCKGDFQKDRQKVEKKGINSDSVECSENHKVMGGKVMRQGAQTRGQGKSL